jgi:hypothetical protein
VLGGDALNGNRNDHEVNVNENNADNRNNIRAGRPLLRVIEFAQISTIHRSAYQSLPP